MWCHVLAASGGDSGRPLTWFSPNGIDNIACQKSAWQGKRDWNEALNMNIWFDDSWGIIVYIYIALDYINRENQTMQLIEAEWRIYASVHWVIIGSDNGLSPFWCQAIIRTNAGILLIGNLGTNFSESLSETHTFSFKKMHLKMSSAKRQLYLRLNVLKWWH